MTYEDLTDQAVLFTREQTATMKATVTDGTVRVCLTEADIVAMLVAFTVSQLSSIIPK